MTALSVDLQPETLADAAAIERLHARAFGPGRYARTAFRLREGQGDAHLPFSTCARVGTLLVGSVRQVPVRSGSIRSMMLGPLTVDPAFQGRGIASALMRRAVEQAHAAGARLVLLVGDAPFYARFGFREVPRGRLHLPGPVDPGRFLVLELEPGALDAAHGAVRPLPVS